MARLEPLGDKGSVAEGSCNRCGARWTGLARCHCSVCHTTFNAITPFDRHRRMGQCLRPADVGLVVTHHPFGDVWGAKPTDVDWRSPNESREYENTVVSEGRGEPGV